MRAIIAATAILLASPAVAAEEQPAMARGIGAKTCGQMASGYAKNPDNTEYMALSWAQGFMSSTNMTLAAAGVHEYRDLGGDAEGHWAYLRQYCDAHPFAEFASAVVELYKTLPLKTHP